jgi:hypothetical protein
MTYGIGTMTPDLIHRAREALVLKQQAIARYERDFTIDPTPQGEDLLRRAKADLEKFRMREYSPLKMLNYPGVLDN